MRRLALLLLVAVSCGGGGPPPPGPGRPPSVRLIGENLTLVPGADRAVRIGFEPFSPAASVRAEFRPDTARVSLCPLSAVDAPVPATGCRADVGSGVSEPLAAPGMRAVAIVLTGDAAVTADVAVVFEERGRAVAIRLPLLPAPPGVCKDNGCNPFFEVIPTRGGAFGARAAWTGGPATLVLLQGRVLARALTGTGVPYAEPARADGPSPLEIRTRMGAPGEYALALRQEVGAGALAGVAIDARWP